MGEPRVKQVTIPKTMIQKVSFLAAVVLVTVLFAWLIVPFYGAILWAVILAVLFDPIQKRLEKSLGGHRNVAAAFSVLVCICIVVIPGSIILAALAQEAAGLYTRLSTQDYDLAGQLTRMQDALPSFALKALSALNLGNLTDIQARLTSFLLQASQAIATKAVTIGQGTAQLFVSLGVMLYLLFFLFRDGRALATIVRKASPLSDPNTDHILKEFTSVMKATVKGNVIIAAIQGVIGGMAFWLIGIDAALLWGLVMAVLSLLPAIGAALIWLPAAVYLLLSGEYLRGVLLLAIGALVISTIDNLLRPPLVGRGSHLPDYVILISTLGGISLIGMNGFVIGPLIAGMFVAVWSLFTKDHTDTR